ncbi:MAG TPA: hypothetical protein VHH94_05805 [Gammaproteobacteria bacterium]|nr:hypothetical protein [Gammaproteobacteria bacterium]
MKSSRRRVMDSPTTLYRPAVSSGRGAVPAVSAVPEPVTKGKSTFVTLAL